MKAKEYADRVLAMNTEQEAISETGKCLEEMLFEMRDLIRKCKIGSDKGIIPVIKEFDQKYRKFVDLISVKWEDVFSYNGFMSMLNHVSPKVYEYYQANK